MSHGYIARRRLRVGDGWIEPGEAYPAEALHPSLLDLRWVEEDHAGEATAPAHPGVAVALTKPLAAPKRAAKPKTASKPRRKASAKPEA